MARLNRRAVIKHAGAISRVAARHHDCTPEPVLCLRPAVRAHYRPLNKTDKRQRALFKDRDERVATMTLMVIVTLLPPPPSR